jgi:dTDP-4-dehydrorhamnose reductase
MPIKIMLLGAGGQLARAFEYQLRSRVWEYVAFTKENLDICDKNAVKEELEGQNPDYVINCAGYTAVDAAEASEADAFRLNAEAVDSLSRICNEIQAVLIHFSTDYVYHNEINRPLIETDPCTPASVYGKSKLAGEKAIMANGGPHFIFRISWLFAPWGNNFLQTMYGLGKSRKKVKVVCDQIGAPTYAPDLSIFVLDSLENLPRKDRLSPPGIYNFSQSGVASWYDFARSIILPDFPDTEIIPVSTEAFPRPAPRPPYSIMDLGKVRAHFQILPRHWRETVNDCLKVM